MHGADGVTGVYTNEFSLGTLFGTDWVGEGVKLFTGWTNLIPLIL
jgi:hypothetical protein